MWAATHLRISSIKLLVSISLCFAFITAINQLNDPGDVIPSSHLMPQLLSTYSNSAHTEAASKSHDAVKQYKAANGTIDEEERFFEGIRNVLNKLQGKETSSLTEPLLQTDTKIGDRKLVELLQAKTSRNEAQESFLLNTITRFRDSEDPSDQMFGDSEFIKLLSNQKPAEAVYGRWLDENVSPMKAIKLLDRSITDSSPDNLKRFFGHDSASPWLSYVGYYWQHKRVEFTENNLFQLFQLAYREEESLAKFLYDARDIPYGLVLLDRMEESESFWSEALAIRIAEMYHDDTVLDPWH